MDTLIKERLTSEFKLRQKRGEISRQNKFAIGDLVQRKTSPTSNKWEQITRKLFLVFCGPFKVTNTARRRIIWRNLKGLKYDYA